MAIKYYSKILSYNLRLLRESFNESQEEMAAKCGLSYRTYQGLEQGSSNPTLSTLAQIAAGAKTTVDNLTRLNAIRTEHSSENFVKQMSERFCDSKIAAGIRTHEGTVLFGNRAALQLVGQKSDVSGTVDLMKVLSGPAREILRYQLECERRGQAQPYLNFTINERGEEFYVKYYPTLVFPSRGSRPYYSAMYMTDPRMESEKDYFLFCEMLLDCA